MVFCQAKLLKAQIEEANAQDMADAEESGRGAVVLGGGVFTVFSWCCCYYYFKNIYFFHGVHGLVVVLGVTFKKGKSCLKGVLRNFWTCHKSNEEHPGALLSLEGSKTLQHKKKHPVGASGGKNLGP